MLNNKYTIGVEEEYMICNPDTGELANLADLIINEIPENLKDRFSYELLLSEIESNTIICEDVDEAIIELVKYRKLLKKIGEKLNYSIGVSGTHPTAKAEDQKFVKNDSYNWVANQLNYYAKRNITFSTHIHIGLSNYDDIIKVTNSLRRWISPLLALSSNSPYFEGVNTGMKSSRTFQFSSFPRTNIAPYIKDPDEYNLIVDKFTKSKAIEKPRQIWWKIRPHFGYKTVEFRVCDIQRSLNNTYLLVSIVQSLVHAIINDENCIEKFNYEYLLDGLWKASRYGTNCSIIDPFDGKVISMENMIKRMLNYINNSIKYFNLTDINNFANNIITNGTEADLQIHEYKLGGFDRLKKYLIDSVDY